MLRGWDPYTQMAGWGVCQGPGGVQVMGSGGAGQVSGQRAEKVDTKTGPPCRHGWGCVGPVGVTVLVTVGPVRIRIKSRLDGTTPGYTTQ